MIKALEIVSFMISAATFVAGIIWLFRKNITEFCRMYIFAIGCYSSEELWVIVNSLLGNGSADGLVTVRLFGFFGCLCFMLVANLGRESEKQSGASGKSKLLPLLAPLILLTLYGIYGVHTNEESPLFQVIIGLLTLAPAFFASYFGLQYLLAPKERGREARIRSAVQALSLVFYAANAIYPHLNLHLSPTAMSVYDLTLTVLFAATVLLCGKEEPICSK